MSPVYLTKDSVERVIEGLSPPSGIAGINVAEGVSNPIKMQKQPPVGLDPSPPPEYAGQEPNVSNPMFDFFVGLTTLIAAIVGIYMLIFKKKKGLPSSETPKKLILRRAAHK
jgi:hypothetical protein